MTNRLEITIKKLSEVVLKNSTFRIDSEYFKAEYLEIIDTLSKIKSDRIEDVTSWVTQGPNPTFEEEGIPCLTGRNINKGRVNYFGSDYLSQSEYVKYQRYQLKIGDTLITLKGKGSIGKVGYVTEDKKAIFSRDIGVIRPKGINPAYVNAFILSSYGRKLIARGETGGTGQSTLTITYLKEMEIPRLKIEDEIGGFVKMSEELLNRSEMFYKQAESLLLEELNFKNIKLTLDTKNIKKFGESFLNFNRLDAEYYQPKYEAFKKIIYDYPNGFQTVKTACNLKDRNFTPIRNSTYKYVELSDIGKSGQILSSTLAEGGELPSRARRRISVNDVIISSVEGSLESCALVSKEYDNSLCSTGFYVLSSDLMNPETLLLIFKSVILQNLLKQHCSGTILTAINKNEFLSIPLPIIQMAIQEKISSIMKESFLLRKRSDRLIEFAKKSIELAIEKGEIVASEFIKASLVNDN